MVEINKLEKKIFWIKIKVYLVGYERIKLINPRKKDIHCLFYHFIVFTTVVHEDVWWFWLFIFVRIPGSNLHGRKRSFTEKYDNLHDHVLRSYMSLIVYGQIRWFMEKKAVVYEVRNCQPGYFNSTSEEYKKIIKWW
jgi:hypothetical protein